MNLYISYITIATRLFDVMKNYWGSINGSIQGMGYRYWEWDLGLPHAKHMVSPLNSLSDSRKITLTPFYLHLIGEVY